jgi:hypothetical protein
MARFDDYDPGLRGHWVRVPLYRAVAAILIMLAISGLLIWFNYPIEEISM